MGKKILILICLVLLLLPVTKSAPTPYTVYGHSSTFANIIVTNANTGESMAAVANEAGNYAVNLGNMNTAWSRGDRIFVNSSSVSKNFTIPAAGYIMRQDLPSEKYLSNTIVTTVEVVALMTMIEVVAP